MKRKVIFGLLVLWVIIAVWLAVGPGGMSHTARENMDGRVQSMASQGGKDRQSQEDHKRKPTNMRGARLGPIVESPLFQGEKGNKTYKKLSTDHVVNELKNGVRTILYPGDEISRDIAMVELRFRKEDDSGEVQPVTVEHISVRRWDANHAKSVDELLEFGAGHPSVEGHAVRVRAARFGEGIRVLGFGRRYLLQCKVVDTDSGEPEFYDSIIKVPDNIPPGKMAVITVFPKYPARSFNTSSRARRKTISAKIKIPLPSTETQWLAAYTHPEDEHNTVTEINSDGTFALGKKPLGGMLRIVEEGREGFAWMCVRSVQQHQLTLPQEADRVIRREQLKQVRLAIPDSYVRDSFVGPWLKTKKDDTGPVVWKALRSDSKAFKEFKSTGIVEFQAPPGRYWVSVFYDPGEPDKRRWVTLGRVTIPRGKPQGPLQIRADK